MGYLKLGLALALTFSGAVHAAGKRKANCNVELIKEASASSIEISFEADSQEECERAKGPEVKTDYSGPPPLPGPMPVAPKKKK